MHLSLPFPHFPDENPDEPKPSGDAGHEDVEQKAKNCITFHDISFQDSLYAASAFKKSSSSLSGQCNSTI